MKAKDYVFFCNNFVGTKEGSDKHRGLVDSYNAIKPLPRGYKLKYTDAWCAAFISAVGYLTGVEHSVLPPECSAHIMYQKFKEMGCVVNKNAGIEGDIVFYDFDNNGVANHVGVISSVTKDKYSVIEGNKSDAVGIRIISKTSTSIMAVCRPKWDVVSTTSANPSQLKSDETIAIEVIQGKWGNGDDRKKRLTNAGYNYKKIQQIVNKKLRK